MYGVCLASDRYCENRNLAPPWSSASPPPLSATPNRKVGITHPPFHVPHPMIYKSKIKMFIAELPDALI
ncbi:hypothetical protein RchiOBHm_Chr7g0213051 [Rosa chinensis]|uniref:Uncharacterized protein n=1 Tax=Rosa chinensis TaxID=74649 RepID=A0A2P6PAW5_ROSCH|nr:hypothetical protein RchiOBHm_Chr7g0213051 [Rosa chinensis]